MTRPRSTAPGGDYRETLQYFRPGFDLEIERDRRAAAGKPETFAEENLYPPTRPCRNRRSAVMQPTDRAPFEGVVWRLVSTCILAQRFGLAA